MFSFPASIFALSLNLNLVLLVSVVFRLNCYQRKNEMCFMRIHGDYVSSVLQRKMLELEQVLVQETQTKSLSNSYTHKEIEFKSAQMEDCIR